MEKYLVQAVLVDGEAERVIDSIKTDNPLHALHHVMKRHRHSYNYKYNVLIVESGHVLNFSNIFQ